MQRIADTRSEAASRVSALSRRDGARAGHRYMHARSCWLYAFASQDGVRGIMRTHSFRLTMSRNKVGWSPPALSLNEPECQRDLDADCHPA
jgi:hypothetical protein